jgi:hypothetical protein
LRRRAYAVNPKTRKFGATGRVTPRMLPPRLKLPLVTVHGHRIVAEASNPNTGETGVVLQFASEAAARHFQQFLVREFAAQCINLDVEIAVRLIDTLARMAGSPMPENDLVIGTPRR